MVTHHPWVEAGFRISIYAGICDKCLYIFYYLGLPGYRQGLGRFLESLGMALYIKVVQEKKKTEKSLFPLFWTLCIMEFQIFI